ncbi:hypothetical protein C8Q80DRAFT_272317 [Daedaleopsis nitida]|nr:hypothetical protein C8Q80DRAFT_272317 [Daedaleopsis nitida]
MGSSPPILNRDILRTVLEEAERATIGTLMRTCRALYQEGARLLLSENVNVGLGGKKKLISFLRFMVAEDGRRWQFLSDVSIFGDPRFSSRHAKILADGIRRARNIRRLKLHGIDEFLSSHQDLTAAVASLPNVKHLEVSRAGKYCCKLLGSARWELLTAQLSLGGEGEGHWDENLGLETRMHPAALLSTSQATLTELHCYLWQPDKLSADSPVYPNVRKLEMDAMIRYPATHEWVRTYPNVRSLDVSTIPADYEGQQEDCDEVHARNRSAVASQGCWSQGLDELSANCADMYILGLTCRVRHVRVSLSAWDLPFLARAMEYALPVRLDITISASLFTSAFMVHLEEAAPYLQELQECEITLDFFPEDQEMNVPRLMVQGASGLRALPNLRKLALHLDGSVAWSLTGDTLAERLDRATFYKAIFSTVPSISTFELGIRLSGMFGPAYRQSVTASGATANT